MRCAVCQKPADRIVVRDEYDQVVGSMPVDPTDEQKDRFYGIVDRTVDPLERAECKDCRRRINQEEN